MLKEFSYWYNCFHKWKSENGDDVETVVECNPITFSGGKGGEREGGKKGRSRYETLLVPALGLAIGK